MFFDLIAGPVGAHRGARSIAPENTLFAARKALETGAHFWECDVRLSGDDVPLIFHDDDFVRTTDVARRPEFASRAPFAAHDFTAAEARTLDAGAWFADTDPYGTVASGEVPESDLAAVRGQRVPTLEEILVFCRDNAFPVNLEIKDHQDLPGHEKAVPLVLDALRRTKTEHLALLSSFNHAYMAAVREAAPHIPTAALFHDALPKNAAAYLLSLGAAACHPHFELVDADLVRALHAEGLKVNAWTVNDIGLGRELLALGVDAVVTDWPQRFQE